MIDYLLQLTPQRSTQYSDMVGVLAPIEFALSSMGKIVENRASLTELAGQRYLHFTSNETVDPAQLRELGWMATVDGLFQHFDAVGDLRGPLLRPIDIRPALPFSPDLVMGRRYRGKTNELFTHFLCNLARYSSGIAERTWDSLRILDPLAGGGTTLVTGLMLGAEVAGVEQQEQDVSSAATFIRHFMREAGIRCKVNESRLKRLGRRWELIIDKAPGRRAILSSGKTTDAVALIDGFRPHLIVTDLPYGIQHQGELTTLLTQALPVWRSLLPPSGTLVFAWDATRFARDEMIAVVESAADLRVRNDSPYDQLAHRVDRVIKRRDILVARPGL